MYRLPEYLMFSTVGSILVLFIPKYSGGRRDFPVFGQGTDVVYDLSMARPNELYCFWGSNPCAPGVSRWSKPGYHYADICKHFSTYSKQKQDLKGQYSPRDLVPALNSRGSCFVGLLGLKILHCPCAVFHM